jgi:hypothetical protein
MRAPDDLDHQRIETSAFSQPADLDEKIFAQGAADAAIGHLHQRLVGAR